MLIDSHCHLSELSDADLKAVIERAQAAGVETLIAIGAGYGEGANEKTLHISKNHDSVYCVLGMHPHDAKEVTEENFHQIKTWVESEPKVRAVGEIGLDYHYLNSPKDVQQQVLAQFTRLAVETNKPVVIHDRDAGKDCVEILHREGARSCGGMVHCFTGTQELAQDYLDLGFFVSFTGIITFKNAQAVRDVVKMVPLERMLIETDSPFLAPVPYRGKTNEPAYVRYVAECVAEVKGVPVEEVARVTTTNAKGFFGL